MDKNAAGFPSIGKIAAIFNPSLPASSVGRHTGFFVKLVKYGPGARYNVYDGERLFSQLFSRARSMHHLLSPSGMTYWLSSWGYQGIFVCIFVGNLGIPIPEELVLLVAGVLAGRKDLDLGTVYLVSVLSVVTGDSCGFLAGRTYGQQLFEWLASKSRFLYRRYQRLQRFFQAHGSSAVFLARFVMGARFMAGPMAGAAGMPFRSFLGWNLLGACVWCSLVITLGYSIGNQLDRVVHLVQEGGNWMAATALLAVVTIWLLWRRKRHHLRHLA